MKFFTLLSHIFIWNSPVCFAVTLIQTQSPSSNSIYLSIYTNETGIKSEISGVMLQVAPESKIQLVSCEIYQKSLLGISALEDIFYIDAYIICDLFWYLLLSGAFSIFVNIYAQVLGFYVFQWTFPPEVSSFGKKLMRWFSDPHLKRMMSKRLNITFPLTCWIITTEWFQTTLYTRVLANITKWMKNTHLAIHVSPSIFGILWKQLSHYTHHPFKNAVG